MERFEKKLPKMIEPEYSFKERISRTTGRTLEFYSQFLDINPETYENKNILNIGAGSSRIGEELDKLNIKPKLLVNVDLVYKNFGDGAGVLKYIFGKSPTIREGSLDILVAADMKRLPFKEETMDDVFFLWSLGWLCGVDQIKAVSEAFRVAKKESEIKIYPISMPKDNEDIFKKYPFIHLEIKNRQAGKLLTSGANEKDLITGAVQYLSNVEMVTVDLAGRFVEFMRGKKIGLMSIVKTDSLSLETLNSALKDLKDSGFIFG